MDNKEVSIKITWDATWLKQALSQSEAAAKKAASSINNSIEGISDKKMSSMLFWTASWMRNSIRAYERDVKGLKWYVKQNPVIIPTAMGGWWKESLKGVGDKLKESVKAWFESTEGIRKFISNVSWWFAGVINGMKKDLWEIWNFWKWLVVPLTVVWGVWAAVVTQWVKESNAVEYERTMATNQFLWQFSDKDKETVKNLAASSAIELWASQEQYYKAIQALWSSNVKGTGEDMAKMAKEVMKYNVTGWSVEDLDTSVQTLTAYIQGLWKTVNLEEIKKASDKLNKLASISPWTDYVVKEQASKTMALGKFAWLSEEETLWIYSSLIGSTWSADEAETQTKRFAENITRFSSEEKQTWQDMWFKVSPDQIIKESWLTWFLKQLKEKMVKAIPSKELGELEKKKKELAELAKPMKQYEISTETIDPETWLWVQIETEESVKRTLEYQKKRADIEKQIKDTISKWLDYSEDPAKENLWNLFQDLNAFLPAIYLTGDGYSKLNENIKELGNSAEETNNRMEGISKSWYFKFDQEAARVEAFRVELWDFVKGEVLEWFKWLNDIIEENKDTIKELASGAIKFLIEQTKDMIEWIKNNKEEIKEFWKDAKDTFLELKEWFQKLWEYWKPEIEFMKDLFKSLSPEIKAAMIMWLAFNDTLMWMWSLVTTTIKSLPLLASTFSTTATAAQVAAWGIWLVSIAVVWVLGLLKTYSNEMKKLQEDQENLQKSYSEMSFWDKTDVTWLDNRIEMMDKAILEMEWWTNPITRAAKRIWMSVEEKITLQQMKDSRLELLKIRNSKDASNDNKQAMTEKVDFDNYLLKELYDKNWNKSSVVVNQTVQWTIVTQNAVNAATNKATSTYNIKNWLTAQK